MRQKSSFIVVRCTADAWEKTGFSPEISFAKPDHFFKQVSVLNRDWESENNSEKMETKRNAAYDTSWPVVNELSLSTSNGCFLTCTV